MEDINYFRDILESIRDYRKIILLKFFIKNDADILKEFGFSDDFIEKLYNECKQIMDSDMDDYFSHIKNLEESLLENNY